MRNFNKRFRLRDTDRQIRLVYTWFLLIMLAGFIFTFVWAHDMTQLTPKGLVAHYRGSDANFGEPMSFGQLAETTHFHLFTMPVVFLIMVHVLYLTMASTFTKVATTWISFLGVTLDLVSPWLITYVSPIYVLTMLAGDVMMTVGFLVMFIIPMREMWLHGRPFVHSEDDS